MSQTQPKLDRESAPSMPRWVKFFGIIALALLLLIIIAVTTGLGGPHGPGRHMPSGSMGDTILVTMHPN